MGPYATQILADLGADVIKVEPPEGDILRDVGPMRNPGMGHIYLHVNRNKRSVVLDLKQPAGRDAALRLAEKSDVLVFNVRPKAMARLGLSYEDVKKVNPKIIYAAAVGYGEGGPYSGKSAYDDLIQGAAAIPALTQMSGADLPRYAPVTLADRSVGLNVAIAINAALYYREKTGRGQSIEVPMFESLVQFVMGDHLGGLSFDPPIGEAGYKRLIAKHRRPYATNDGYVCVLIYNDKQWQSFFDLIGKPELKDDPRFRNHTERGANIAEIYAYVADIMQTRSTADWLQALDAADIPVMPMHTPSSLVTDPHLEASGFFQLVEHPTEGMLRMMKPTLSWSEGPLTIRSLPPSLGQHSAEILREAGYSNEDITEMVKNQVTRTSEK
jgi:crotonobetainyl-CoA:carnitine CoA-transferase CaiB-like acyl-CoA transferase